MIFDLILRNGTVYDGMSDTPVRCDVGILNGHVAAIEPNLDGTATEEIDADGCWVMPGFVDNHTHYDAEVLLAPGLGESVRHGVTTVCIGSCSLSTIHSTPEQCADLFSRVEAVPHRYVLEALTNKGWTTARDYRTHLESLPLGPNVMSFVGHSDLRTAVMGLDAATSNRPPTQAQMEAMEQGVHDALDAGFLGLSCMTNPWDKVGGSEARSRPLPSTFAKWSEYRRLHRILRDRGAILQSAPNITTKVNAALYLMESASFGVRASLKTTLITVADTKSNPLLASVVLGISGLWERLFGSNFRWQSLPVPFEVYADGVDLVVFEEFGAGEEALHLTEQIERNALFADPAYRRRFRKDYERKYGPRVWHRDFHDATIVSAPDESLAGRTIGEVADERGAHPVDAFLDMVMEHGTAFRWKTTIANHRPDKVRMIAAHPSVHLGFADSGAHLRNMAFYNFPLQLLRMAVEAERDGIPFLSVPQAVHRLTAEIADWYGVDAGHIRVGDRADIAIIDPAGLNASLDGYHEAPVEVFGGLSRMVKRNDDAVVATIIAGRAVFQRGVFATGFGESFGTGQFLAPGTESVVQADVAMASK